MQEQAWFLVGFISASTCGPGHKENSKPNRPPTLTMKHMGGVLRIRKGVSSEFVRYCSWPLDHSESGHSPREIGTIQAKHSATFPDAPIIWDLVRSSVGMNNPLPEHPGEARA